MTAEQLKEDVIRAEGYAEGFRVGYTTCAQRVAGELAKEAASKSGTHTDSSSVKSESGGAVN